MIFLGKIIIFLDIFNNHLNKFIILGFIIFIFFFKPKKNKIIILILKKYIGN